MSSTIDQGFAAWLKADELAVTVAGANAATWPTQGVQARRSSPFATLAGAQAEAARRLAVFGGPLVREKVVITGRRADLVGRCFRLHAPDLAPTGELVIAIAAAEQDNNTTIVTIIRKLS